MTTPYQIRDVVRLSRVAFPSWPWRQRKVWAIRRLTLGKNSCRVPVGIDTGRPSYIRVWS